ncbi:MAG TPA: nucleotidyltransferase domain-containing protein [bacterium]|jgi:hypothetical protein
MKGPKILQLRAAIEELYEAFAQYPLVLPMSVCDCGCVTPHDIKDITGKSLRDLSARDLEKYAFKALTTWGEAHDFKHFLPRLLELTAESGEVGHTPPETLFGKLHYGEWRAWPVTEQHAIETYFAAFWRHGLRMSPDSARGRAFDVDTYLTALGRALDDLGPFLDEWRNSQSPPAIERLADFVSSEYNELTLYGALRNAHWEERKEQMRQVMMWLAAPETKQQLQTGLARARSRRAREALQQALDRLSRLPAGELPVRPEVRDPELPHDVSDVVHGRQPYPLLFAAVSGAHLYGFPSRDSDYDVRGAHILPADAVLGLVPPRETIEDAVETRRGRVELVTHDVRKYFAMILKRNGYVLEQIYSPLGISSSREHAELEEIARRCVTRGHAGHYLGFAESQWRMLEKKGPRVKLLLYVFRVLLTGINLMRTGEIEANLLRLNEEFKLTYLDDLVARKIAEDENVALPPARLEFLEAEYLRLREVLAASAVASALPEVPTGADDLNDLLLRLRHQSLPGYRPPRRRGSKRIDREIAEIEGNVEFLTDITKDILGELRREDSDS